MSDRAILTIVFFILGFLNLLGYMEFTTNAIFGLTFGCFLISVFSCFEIEKEVKGKKIFIILRDILKVMSYLSMIGFAFIKNNPVVQDFMKSFDDKTMLLLSIGFSLFAITTSEIESKRKLENIKRDTTKKMIDEFNKRIEGDR